MADAHFAVDPVHPNVLLVWGADVYRKDFHANLIDLPGCPISLATHDFWIIHDVAPIGDAVSTLPPPEAKRLKRFVTLESDLTRSSLAVMRAYADQFCHEVGHYWLVPQFAVRIGHKAQPVRTTKEFIDAFFAVQPIPSLCLLAKQSSHWTCYMSAGRTTFESLPWEEREVVSMPLDARRLPEWDGVLRRYEVAAPLFMGLQRAYSDLDLYLMGVLAVDEAYAAVDGRWTELVPQWVTPIEAMAGICMAFAPDDVVLFGFHGGHQRVSVERTGATVASKSIEDVYSPQAMWESNASLALRVVRLGDECFFQMRVDLDSTPVAPPFHLKSSWLPPTTSPDDWMTVAQITVTAPPVAAGYMVKTWGATPPLVDLRISSFVISTDSETRVVSVSDAETDGSADWRSAVAAADGRFVFHRPKQGPVVVVHDATTDIVVGATVPSGDGVAEVGNHDHWTGVDDAPKLLTKLPDSRFIAAGRVALRRTALAPHAAGAMEGRHLWAVARPRSIGDVELDDEMVAHQKTPFPYRCAFIVMAPDRAAITDQMVANVDARRTAAANAFRVATLGRRTIDTTLV